MLILVAIAGLVDRRTEENPTIEIQRADANAQNSNVIQITAVRTMATHAVRIEVVVGVGNIAERWLRSCRKMTMTRSGRGSRNACISFRDFSKSMYF